MANRDSPNELRFQIIMTIIMCFKYGDTQVRNLSTYVVVKYYANQTTFRKHICTLSVSYTIQCLRYQNRFCILSITNLKLASIFCLIFFIDLNLTYNAEKINMDLIIDSSTIYSTSSLFKQSHRSNRLSLRNNNYIIIEYALNFPSIKSENMITYQEML
jgi:hypothetical protein